MAMRLTPERANGSVMPVPAPTVRSRVAFHASRVGVLLAVAIATYALFPAGAAVESPIFEVGSVATRDVIAPIAFAVPKPAADLEQERDELARTVRPIFVYQPAALPRANRALAQFMDSLDAAASREPHRAETLRRAAATAGVVLTVPEAGYLTVAGRRRTMRDAVGAVFTLGLPRGVAAAGALADARGELVIRRDGIDRPVLSDSLATFATLVSGARASHPDPDSPLAEAISVKLVGAFFQPSLTLDQGVTEARRTELRASVSPYVLQVREGEKIIGAHEVVGRSEYDKMRALHAATQGRARGEAALSRLAGAILYNALVLAIFGMAIVLFRPRLYDSMAALGLFAGVFLAVTAGAAAAAHWAPGRPELVPVAFAAIILSIVFDPRISLVAAMIVAVLVGGQGAYRGTNALFINLVGGAAAALSARVMLRRTQTYQYVIIIALAYLAAAVAIGLTLGWTATDIGKSALVGVLNAIVSVVFAVFLIPLAERLTGVTSPLTLIEYSDLNRPLLKRLSTEAPGTYAHTMALANLVEAACNAVGANGLLGRVGAYYHDIGKLKKPNYFVENQMSGRNPHDKLKPSTSASIIKGHIREGMELAHEYRVPAAIAAFIPEHHGTAPITFFWEKAKERDGASGLNAADFAYPGPPPQSAETAICMLADSVEAAVRVLADPTPPRVREVVDHLVRQRIDQGQLRNAPLTLRQLDVIKDQFARVLAGMYHARIEYPASGGGVSAEFTPS